MTKEQCRQELLRKLWKASEVLQNNPAKSRAFFVKAGIVTPEGKLTERYASPAKTAG